MTSAFAKKATDKLNVAVIAVNYNSPSITLMANIAMADCKTRGWTCELHDGKGDQVATNSAAINFINRKFDAIVNIASDNNQMGAVIKAANAANIPNTSFPRDVAGSRYFCDRFFRASCSKNQQKSRDRLCLRLPRFVLLRPFRPNKGSKHRYAMT